MSNDTFIDTFKEEALELLGTLETNLLELEEDPENKELLSAVFRVMHTIKGSASMFGLDQVAAFSHEVESILSSLRDGKIVLSKQLIDNTLISRDFILGMLSTTGDCIGPLSSELEIFLDEFKTSVGYCVDEKCFEKKRSVIVVDNTSDNSKKEVKTWHITYKPGKDSFRRGSNPLSLVKEIVSLGETVCIPNFDRVTSLSEFDPEDCVLSWELFVSTTASENQIRDIFIFVEDFSEIKIECLLDFIDESGRTTKKLGEILIEQGKLDNDSLNRILKSQKRLGEILIDEKIVSPIELKIALEEQHQIQKAQKNKIIATENNTIRVKSEKLDQLMSLVGELVTVHAQILQTTKQYAQSDVLLTIVEQFGRLTDELRNNTMSIRMIPIGNTFTNFKRLVRDLSSELGKNIELQTSGGDTELDKTIIEKLNDPLIHIIRNSLDHGIEKPDVRSARGKSKTGLIQISAAQTGASVYITIEDDGNGLDTEAIRKKAIAKGIIKSDQIVSEQELYQLIFEPGFSTKEIVTAVSGRGVGMDVVNRQLELINGSITIESKLHSFTRITLKIPLTLAIIEGFLVRISSEYYIIPLLVVVGCLEYMQDKKTNNNNDIVIFHEKQLPFINMRTFFDIPGERQNIEQIVVVSIKNRQVGILVDQVIGSSQTVIKPLGKLYKNADGISSATIQGDGSVALILDVEAIVEKSELQSKFTRGA